MSDVNKQLLDALIAVRHELDRCQAVIHLAGGFDPHYVSCAKVAICKADEAIASSGNAQPQPHPYAGKRKGHPDGDFSYRCGSDYCRCAQ